MRGLSAAHLRILSSSFAEQHGRREPSAQDKETLARHLFVDYQAQNKHLKALKSERALGKAKKAA